MESASTVEFAQAARRIGRAARQLGLDAPSYRCPPKVVGADRTVRRRPTGAVVAVRVAGRPIMAVVADLIEGVVVANRLTTPMADRVRRELWEVASSQESGPAAATSSRPASMPGAA